MWIYRFRDYLNGRAIQRTVTVGTVKQYPTESDAKRAVESLRLDLNRERREDDPGTLISFRTLAQHYEQHEFFVLPGDERQEGEKAASTKTTFRRYLRAYILPQWGDCWIRHIRSVDVEDWLRHLTRNNGGPMANGTKVKLRSIMHVVFQHAVRYEFTDKNPISCVRQSGKRAGAPAILNADELRALLRELEIRDRTLVLLAAGTGLRRGELTGLRWGDIDFALRQANVRRSFCHEAGRGEKKVGPCKTEVSQKPVPLDECLLAELERWRSLCIYNRDEDWVFASEPTKGRQPLWLQMIIRKSIKPAAERAGIRKTIGGHTFRRSYTSLLKANGEDVKVVQELLRHANVQTTMNIYAQALTPDKRRAQSKVVEMIVGEKRQQLWPTVVTASRASCGKNEITCSDSIRKW